jgi:hypothetical protein
MQKEPVSFSHSKVGGLGGGVSQRIVIKRKKRDKGGGYKNVDLCLLLAGCEARSKDQPRRTRVTYSRQEGALLVGGVGHLDLGVPRYHKRADRFEFLNRQESSWACMSNRSIDWQEPNRKKLELLVIIPSNQALRIITRQIQTAKERSHYRPMPKGR